MCEKRVIRLLDSPSDIFADGVELVVVSNDLAAPALLLQCVSLRFGKEHRAAPLDFTGKLRLLADHVRLDVGAGSGRESWVAAFGDEPSLGGPEHSVLAPRLRRDVSEVLPGLIGAWAWCQGRRVLRYGGLRAGSESALPSIETDVLLRAGDLLAGDSAEPVRR